MRRRCALAAMSILGVVVVWFVPIATADLASADGGVHFVDQRGATIYLDRAASQKAWRVKVFNGDTTKTISVTLVISPENLLTVDSPSTIDIPAKSVATFGLRFISPNNTAGSAQLSLLASDGTIDRRDVSVVEPGGELILPDELSFSGLHPVPWSRRVHLPPVPLVDTPPNSSTVVVGTLTASSGRTGQVELEGNKLLVRGIHAAGDYRGLASLPDGRKVKIRAEIRDAIGVPLLVLLTGLAAVGFLDRYNKRDRPRQILALDLARLRANAAAAQSAAKTRLRTLPPNIRPISVHRITDPSQEQRLLLDRKVDDALALWKTALDDAARASWAEGEPSLNALHQSVEDFAQLHDDLLQLGIRLSHLMSRLSDTAPGPETPVLAAYISATTSRDLTTDAELVRLKADVALAQSVLGQFQRLLGHLHRIKEDTGDAQIRVRANHLLDRLCRGALQDDIDIATEQLAKDAVLAVSSEPDRDIALRPDRTARIVSLPVGAAAQVSIPVGAAVEGPPPASRTPRRTLLAVSLCAVAVLGLGAAAIGMTNILTSSQKIDQSRTGAGGLILPIERRPDLPVGPSRGAPLPGSSSSDVSITEAEIRGVALPVVAGGAFVCLVWLAVRWRHDRHEHRIEGRAQDPVRLSETLRRDQRRFSLLSGLLVVLTGLSTLYFTNPTFGSLGDYAKLLLWGTAVGEGVQLARRVLPSLPT